MDTLFILMILWSLRIVIILSILVNWWMYLYIINHISFTLELNELNNTNSIPYKRKEPSKMNQMYHWNLRPSHINLKIIARLVENWTLGTLELVHSDF